MIRDMAIVTMERYRNSYAIYRMVLFSMTVSRVANSVTAQTRRPLPSPSPLPSPLSLSSPPSPSPFLPLLSPSLRSRHP